MAMTDEDKRLMASYFQLADARDAAAWAMVVARRQGEAEKEAAGKRWRVAHQTFIDFVGHNGKRINEVMAANMPSLMAWHEAGQPPLENWNG